MTHGCGVHEIGAWCWHVRHAAPCCIVDMQEIWGEVAYRVWLPYKDTVDRARSADLTSLDSVQPSVEHILHTVAAAKLLDALEENLLLAPIQSNVVPLPHQLYALNRAMSRDRIRYLLADEVGLQNVRDYRGERLKADHDARMTQLNAAEIYSPDLNAVLMLRVGEQRPDPS